MAFYMLINSRSVLSENQSTVQIKNRETLRSINTIMKSNTLSLSLLTVAFVMVVASLQASPGPAPQVPDAGSSAMLMTAGIAGIAFVKRFMR